MELYYQYKHQVLPWSDKVLETKTSNLLKSMESLSYNLEVVEKCIGDLGFVVKFKKTKDILLIQEYHAHFYVPYY